MQLRYIPNKGPNSHFFLPLPVQVPPGDARGLGFNFPQTPPLGTASQDVGIIEDIVLYGIGCVVSPVGGAAAPRVSLLFYHSHKGVQRQLNLQPVHQGLICGTASNPSFLRVPVYLRKGDVLTCEIANACVSDPHAIPAGNYAPADIFIVLDGVTPD